MTYQTNHYFCLKISWFEQIGNLVKLFKEMLFIWGEENVICLHLDINILKVTIRLLPRSLECVKVMALVVDVCLAFLEEGWVCFNHS